MWIVSSILTLKHYLGSCCKWQIDGILLFLPQKKKICMKCQSLFSGKKSEKYFKMKSTDFFTHYDEHQP